MWSSFTYHEPSIVQLLILSSWLYLLNLFGWISQHLLSAQLLGQILIGIIYGEPLAGWLDESWQEAFIAVGYLGLLLIVFEGGLSSSFNNVITLLPLSICIALTGILLPIGLSFILMPLASFSPLHAFAAGAALSSTSLGTSLSVLNPASVGFDLRQSKLGTALLSAAVLDDVVAFVLSNILGTLGQDSTGTSEIGKNVGRTIGVTIGIGIALIPCTRYALKPMYGALVDNQIKLNDAAWAGEPSFLGFMTLIFVGLIAATGFAGTSPLYGAYIAGLACAYLSDSTVRAGNSKSGYEQSEIGSADRLEHGTESCGEGQGPGHGEVEMVDFRLRRHKTFPGSPTPSTFGCTHQSLHISLSQPVIANQIEEGHNPSLRSSFEIYLTPILTYLLVPIFFGSIGYCIPFVPLWKGRIIWRGIIYAILMLLGKLACGIWLVVWIKPKRSTTRGGDVISFSSSWKGAVFLGSAMVARGEIGLLISQIAYNTHTPLLKEDEFLIVNWGIILCTIIGPLSVGWTIRRWGRGIMDGGWD
ncbi:uncharacterized protein I303_103291 [Kwoniella dejecticola CBS 10117]|uniref:Cation/H+ exchanger transmembrane domain-containing protein n=1 Tax=Kwoniella dejecticola CBS 10117 TaxID=1296121 RepID=A0AAJ8KNA7_9TREE